MRGGEWVLYEIARLFPTAKIYTLVHRAGSVIPELERHPIKTSWLQLPSFGGRRWRYLLPLMPAAMENFDFAAQPSINETLVRELINGEYLQARENVLLIGNSGTGKSHVATALGFAACAQGRRVRFWGATALVTHMLEMREQHELKRFFARMEKHDLIILDELGYVPFSKAGAELLFEVVSRAYERHSLIVTTNLPFEQWTEVMGSERLTGALLDRLTHRVHIIEANGESYRLKESKRRQQTRRKRAK